MDRTRTLTYEEILRIALRLRELDNPLPAGAVPGLAAELGWRVLRVKTFGVLFDIGLGPTSGRAQVDEGIMVNLTATFWTQSPNDAEAKSMARDVFTQVTWMLSAAFGNPSSLQPGPVASLRWPGATYTLVLRNVEGSLQLSLMDNEGLALDDRADELDDEELM